MTAVKRYLSLVKFSHTIFAMPFALIGFFLGYQAWGQMQLESGFSGFGNFIIADKLWIKFLLVILCMIFARSAAMGFNRYLDRSFDALNPRTAIREIPAGIIHANSALVFVILNAVAFIVCCWFINPLCFVLSFVALFVVLFYSYTKRFTALCHLVLGLGLSLAPIGAYLAVTGKFSLLPLLFSFSVICWVSGFDIIYALQDVHFDKDHQLHSIPALFGAKTALHISEFLHLLSAGFVVTAGFYGHFGLFYWLGIGVFVGMLIYQHSIVKPNDLRRVNLAFMTANGVASVVFAIFVLTDIFIS